MKALSQTLYLVVAAVVILVTALVILTLFWRGIGPAVGLTEARSLCQTQAEMSCQSFNKVPATWNVQNMNVVVNGVSTMQSCQQALGPCTCDSSRHASCSAPSQP